MGRDGRVARLRSARSAAARSSIRRSWPRRERIPAASTAAAASVRRCSTRSEIAGAIGRGGARGKVATAAAATAAVGRGRAGHAGIAALRLPQQHRRSAQGNSAQNDTTRKNRTAEQEDETEKPNNSRRVMTAARHKHPAAAQSARPPPPQLRRARQSRRIGRRGVEQARRSSVSPRPEHKASQSEIRGPQRTTASRETASSRVNSRPRKRKRDHHTAERIGHACESHQRLAQLLGRLQHRLQLRPSPFPNVRLHRRGRCEAIARRIRKHLAEKPTQTLNQEPNLTQAI